MMCDLHPNYVPHNGDPTDTIELPPTTLPEDDLAPCPYCWQARSYWLHENRKLHIVIAQELREKAGHFTPDSRIEFLEAQIQKLKKQLQRKNDLIFYMEQNSM